MYTLQHADTNCSPIVISLEMPTLKKFISVSVTKH